MWICNKCVRILFKKKYAKNFFLFCTKNKKNPLKNEIKGGSDEFHFFSYHQKDYHHKGW